MRANQIICWIERGLILVSVLFFMWVGFSWLDIVADNCSSQPEHSPYNAFVLLMDLDKEM